MNQKKSGPRTDVVQDAIRPYAIAEKLRNLRLRKSMGLIQLAAHTGLSPAMLSKLENGRLIPTLVRIATVFDVGLEGIAQHYTDESISLAGVTLDPSVRLAA